MSDVPFDVTPEFERFKKVMRGVMSISKKKLDEMVKASKEQSPRNSNPNAPGRKKEKDKKTGQDRMK